MKSKIYNFLHGKQSNYCKMYFTFLFMFLCSISQAQFVIVTQDFEGNGLPAGWTRTQNTPSAGWEFGSNLGSSYFPIPAHTKYAASNDDAHDDNSTTANIADRDRLITPAMNLQTYAGEGIILEFDYIQPGTYGSTGHIEVSTDGGANWAQVMTVTPSIAWRDTFLFLTPYTAYTNVKVAFKSNDNGNWAEGMGIDDVLIKTVPALDATVTSVKVNAFVASGQNTISATVRNVGSTSIQTLVANYTINGGSPVSQTFTGLNLQSGNSAQFTFTTQANLSVGNSMICVTTGNVDGGPDGNLSNNQLCKTVSALSYLPVKKTLLEAHVGAWNQFTPDVYPALQTIKNVLPSVIQFCWHNSDAMTLPAQDSLATDFSLSYPEGTVDRVLFPSETRLAINRGIFEAKCSERNAEIVPVAVSVIAQTYDSITRALTVTVKANFVGPMSGDIRMNAFVIEDSVSGTGSGYDQVNYYNTTSGHSYYGAGNPITGFQHRHVVRAALGGAWGITGTIPTTVNVGDDFTHTFSYTVPVGVNLDRISLVGLVQLYNSDPNQRPVLNAESVLFTKAGFNVGIKDEGFTVTRLYPNPVHDRMLIEFELQNEANVSVCVFDITGRKIATLTDGGMNSGRHTISWNTTLSNGDAAAPGQYLVVLNADGKTSTNKIILAR